MATAGKTSVGGTEDFDSTNDGDVQGPYTVGADSTITEFHAYLRSTGAGATDPKFRPLVYADNAGEPGTLIATLPEITIALADTTGAWRDITGLSVSTGSNTAIWIGLWFNGVNHRYVYDTPGGNTSRYDASMLTYSSSGDAPSSWDTAGDSTSTQEKSLYVVYTAAGSNQLLAPAADSADGNWKDSSGGTSLAAQIDETSASDTDYILSELSPQTSACRVKLATGTDPASSTGHSIKWRAAKDATGGDTVGITVSLYQGGGNSLGAGTLIASFTRSNVSNTYTDFTETLNGTQADSITNYADLYLEFSADT